MTNPEQARLPAAASSDTSSDAGKNTKALKDARNLIKPDKNFSGLSLWVKGAEQMRTMHRVPGSHIAYLDSEVFGAYSTIGHRCKHGPFLVSGSCVTTSNPDSIFSSEKWANPE